MDKYEISIWEDYSDVTSKGKTFLNERKIAVIGSDTMRAQARALEPNLIEDINGTHTFTFRMYYTYVDNETGEEYANPFGKYLINERKIKVFWKNEWYDLVIKKCQEDTSKKSITYTCTDLFINELSKQGYSLEFDTELQNNIGTAKELATAVLDGSTWQYDTDKGTPIIQRTEGPMYEATIKTDFMATLQYPGGDILNKPISKSKGKILVFYDSVVDVLTGANEDIQECQFLYTEDIGWATDINDSLVINGDCYVIKGKWSFNQSQSQLQLKDLNSNTLFYITPNEGISNYRGKRLVKSQRTEYDSLLDRYVLLCEEGSGENKKEVYEIATTEYSDPLAVVNLIANPTDFTSVAGWIGDSVKNFGIYPKLLKDQTLNNYKSTSYLKVSKEGKSNIIYNTGIKANLSQFSPTDSEIRDGTIGGIQANEKFIFRYKVKADNNGEPADEYCEEKVLSIQVCKYTKSDEGYSPDSEQSILEDISENGSQENDNGWVEHILICKTNISAFEISNYGIFIEISSQEENITYWIEDIQLFKYVMGVTSYSEDAEKKRMNPGEVSLQSYATPVYKYYYKDNKAQKADELTYIYVGEEEKPDIYKPVYNSYERIGTITEKESNRFNILQSIAETFQAWIKFRIDHEENGAIKFINGIPQKFVYFVEEIGEETGISFEYGIDLKTISRTIDSDKLATKVIVKNNTNEFAKNGFCSIARSDWNYSKENFILNLDYYTQQNLLDKDALNKDLYGTSENDLGYYYHLHEKNKTYDAITDELVVKNRDLIRQTSQRKTYEEYLSSAENDLQEIKSELINIAGTSQWEESGDQSPSVEKYIKDNASQQEIQKFLITYGEIKSKVDEYTRLLEELNNSIDILEKYITKKQNDQNTLLKDIKEIHEIFNNKYSAYIMEGTWQDENYVDDDKYYLDGINIAYTSSRPQLSYSINVLRLSSLDEYSSKVFHLGDICYMQDREFFGYLPDKITPYKEKILVSKISSFFDEPERDVLTIQNYKTRFDDLFQRIAATTQSLQYAEGTFTRAASIINPDKTLSFAALQDTFDQNYDLILNSSNQDISWDDTGITVTNKFNSADKTKIIAGGIFVTNDGGETWKNAVRGDGISADVVTAGRINTSEVYIYNGNTPSFRWDGNGITAYSNTNNGTTFNKFVRFDQYGVYGYSGEESFVPSSLEEVENKANFALTWKGFALKSVGTNGIFEISTENDLIVKTKQEGSEEYDERIKIGRVGKKDGNDIYGIVIKNYEKIGNVSQLKEILRVDNDSATIAGWDINSTSIEKDGVGLYSTPINDYYIRAGSNFGVKADGSIFASAGTIGGWTITSNSIQSINPSNSNQFTKIWANGEIEGQIDKNTRWSISRSGFQFLDLSGSQSKDPSGNQIILGNTKITNNTLYTSNISASGGSVGGVGLGTKGNNISIVDGSIFGNGWTLSNSGLSLNGGTVSGTGWSLGQNGLILNTVSAITINGRQLDTEEIYSLTGLTLRVVTKSLTIDGQSVTVVTGLSGTYTYSLPKVLRAAAAAGGMGTISITTV